MELASYIGILLAISEMQFMNCSSQKEDLLEISNGSSSFTLFTLYMIISASSPFQLPIWLNCKNVNRNQISSTFFRHQDQDLPKLLQDLQTILIESKISRSLHSPRTDSSATSFALEHIQWIINIIILPRTGVEWTRSNKTMNTAGNVQERLLTSSLVKEPLDDFNAPCLPS